MFKRFIGAFVAVSMIASPVLAGSYSSGKSYSSSSSSRSSSYGSSYKSSSYSSRPSYSSGSSYKSNYTSSYSRPAAAAPRYTSGSSYNYKPTQTAVVPRSSNRYNGGGNTYVNHNYGGGYGGGGTFSSPWFWMWALDRHQQPVYVNTGGAPMQGEGGYYGAPVNNSPGFFSMIFWGIFNLLILIGVIWLIVWIVRKFIFRK